jgi:hypothetical protein
MRRQQPAELAWDDIPLQTQLDVLIYDMVEGGHWDIVERWTNTRDSKDLQHALALRRHIWDQNTLPRSVGLAYTETSTYYVANDHRALHVRNCLLELLSDPHTHSPDGRSSASPGTGGGG